MIIGANRKAVIENIKTAAEKGDFYAKVEISDPVLSPAESKAITDKYILNRKKIPFKIKSLLARTIANILTSYINTNTEIKGFEKLSGISSGVIITSNHFGPLENTVIRHLAKKTGKKRLNVISQVTNFAMPGFLGFFMNYADTVPISMDPHYLNRDFLSVLSELLAKKEFILLYPEQEMWFNYRKPRPPKRGAYYYAAKLNVPIVSCFVEIVDLKERDTKEFFKVKYILHILDVLYPHNSKTTKENSINLCERDYLLKKQAYEKAYGKPLDYTFEDTDIAGLIGE